MSGETAAQLNAHISQQRDSDAVIGSVNKFLRENESGGESLRWRLIPIC